MIKKAILMCLFFSDGFILKVTSGSAYRWALDRRSQLRVNHPSAHSTQWEPQRQEAAGWALSRIRFSHWWDAWKHNVFFQGWKLEWNLNEVGFFFFLLLGQLTGFHSRTEDEKFAARHPVCLDMSTHGEPPLIILQSVPSLKCTCWCKDGEIWI